jgi:hypothetical protein
VLSDYAAMEAYKGNTLLSFSRSMKIACECRTLDVVTTQSEADPD